MARSDDDDDDDTKRRHKKKKKHHKKKKKKRKHENDDDNAKKRRKQPLYFDLGARYRKTPARQLDASDYYEYHKHLWLYVFRQGVCFDDLDREEAQSYFASFCHSYNAGKLPAAYYADELPRQALEECQTTRHAWGFQLSNRDDQSLRHVQEGIYQQTEYRPDRSVAACRPVTTTTVPTDAPPPRRPVPRGPDYRAQRRRDHLLQEMDDRKLEGHEKLRDQRREVGRRLHGAADQAVVELNDEAVYGNEDYNDFRQSLASLRRRNEKRQERKQSRVSELEQKEQAKQQAMMDMLGLSERLQGGQKITITPRDT